MSKVLMYVELEQKNREIERLKKEVEELKAGTNQSEESIKQLEELRAENADLQTKNEVLIQNNDDMQTVVQNLRKENDELREGMKGFREELTAEITRLSKELAEAQAITEQPRRVLDAAAAAEYCKTTVSALQNLRTRNQPPPYQKVSGRIEYNIEDLDVWLATRSPAQPQTPEPADSTNTQDDPATEIMRAEEVARRLVGDPPEDSTPA